MVRSEAFRGPRGGPDEGRASLAVLKVAADDWLGRGRTEALVRWFRRELDPEGVPRSLPVSEWSGGLALVLEAARGRPSGWPDWLEAMAEGWFRALLRFSRSDGSSSLSKGPSPGDARGLLRGWAERLPDPGLLTVVDWWFPNRGAGHHAPPPLPADARPDRLLAVLRANWVRRGDFVAVDHRRTGPTSLVELVAGGRPWLGPRWEPAGPVVEAGRARPTCWVSHGSADLAEWTFRVGRARVTRSALFLRGRRIALLSEQWDGPGDPGGWRLGLAPGVQARPAGETRAHRLSAVGSRAGPRVLPFVLPCGPATVGGGLRGEDGVLALDLPVTGRRTWRALLVSWEPSRDRTEASWRPLTVTADRRVCRADEAVAFRIWWRRDESLVVYRSLARPALRAFLGHQTRARFLVGLFSTAGTIGPLMKVEDGA